MLERSIGMDIWSGVEWSQILEWKSGLLMPTIQTKPGHVLENTKNRNFHSAGVGVNS